MTPEDAHIDHSDPDGHTDCALVIAEVWTLLDGEVTDAKRDRLQRHLEQCPAPPECRVFAGETAAEIGAASPRKAKAAGRG